MADEVKVEFDTRELNQAIRRYENKSKNLPMDVVGQLMVNEAEGMFQTQGAAGSEGPWQSFNPNTILRDPKRAGGMLLQKTGATANIQVESVSEFSVSVISPTGYSGFHIEGNADLPERDFFAYKFSSFLDSMGDLVLQEYQR